MLIIMRVAQGHAWSVDTAKRIATGTGLSRTQTAEIGPNIDAKDDLAAEKYV